MRKMQSLLTKSVATALVLGAFAAATAIPKPEDAQTRDVVLREEGHHMGTTDLAELVERQSVVYVALAVTLIAQKVWSAVSWAIGLYGLAYSGYSVYKDCVQQYGTSDCINSAIGLLIAAYANGYKATSGFRRYDGRISYGTWEDSAEPRRTSHIHVPLINGTGSVKVASVATENNGTWERHATFYWEGKESQILSYRLASADDLGFENDGDIHHYRLEDSDRVKALQRRGEIEKRIEKRSYGVVTDYLWKNNDNSLWSQMHDSADFNDMASKTAKYLQDHTQEVSCLTTIAQVGSHGGSTNTRIDNGIVAYGWNDQPYGFNGRAGSWVEGCKGNNI